MKRSRTCRDLCDLVVKRGRGSSPCGSSCSKMSPSLLCPGSMKLENRVVTPFASSPLLLHSFSTTALRGFSGPLASSAEGRLMSSYHEDAAAGFSLKAAAGNGVGDEENLSTSPILTSAINELSLSLPSAASRAYNPTGSTRMYSTGIRQPFQEEPGCNQAGGINVNLLADTLKDEPRFSFTSPKGGSLGPPKFSIGSRAEQ